MITREELPDYEPYYSQIREKRAAGTSYEELSQEYDMDERRIRFAIQRAKIHEEEVRKMEKFDRKKDMCYRAITMYKQNPFVPGDNIPYYQVESIPKERLKEKMFRFASPEYKFDSEEAVVRSFGTSRRELVLLSGKSVIPLKENFPEYWETEELFNPWNPNTKELWPGEY